MTTMSGTRTIRVFLLDDHEIVRRGVRELLEAQPDLEVVGEAGSATTAVAAALAATPDVAVLDVRLPDGDGISVCRELRDALPGIGCLMLTSFADDEALTQAVLAGAAGYVLKQIRGQDLVGAVRAVAAGHCLLDPVVVAQVMRRLHDGTGDPFSALTPQERRILSLIGEGLTNRQIASQLHLAEKTVKNYVSALLAKLNLTSRTQAAVMVARNARGVR